MTVKQAPVISDAQTKTNEKLAKATVVLALGNVSSRVLGLLREVVLTNLFGASAAVDAFKVATLVPKSIYDLLIAGHVNGAIIPVLSEIVTQKGKDELWRLVSVLLSIITALLAILVLLVEVFAPFIVRVFAGGSDAYTQALAVDLLRLTSVALIFMGVFAILSGTLYALRSFTWPAFATAMFNGVIVIVALFFSPLPRFYPQVTGVHVNWVLARPEDGITIVAIGWLLGSIAYMLLQLPGLRGAKIHLTLNWKHPAIRQIGILYIPVMFSLIMDTLIIRPFSYNLASQTGEGSIGIMDWATTLIQFPQGLVATAISIAILPTLSRQAALSLHNNDENTRAFKDTLGLGLRLAITLILPATIGLYVLATPIISLLFEHGAFTAQSTVITALALRVYLVGLPFAAIDLLLVYAFYAKQDTLTPALIGLFSLVIYMVVATLMMPRYGLLSLMMADSIKHIIHATVSAYLLHRRLDGFGDQRLMITTLKSGLAVIGMGIVAALLLPVASTLIGTQGTLNELLLVVFCGGVSSFAFLLFALILRVEEWLWLVKTIGHKLNLS